MWKDAVSRGTEAAHAGWKAAVWRRDGCGRIALVERRAAERGALRARFRRASIVYVSARKTSVRYENRQMVERIEKFLHVMLWS
jgi:hypothetical protein